MKLHVVGIDLGKTVFHLVGLDSTGTVVSFGTCPIRLNSSVLKRPTGLLRRLKSRKSRWIAKQCTNHARGGDQNSIQLRNI